CTCPITSFHRLRCTGRSFTTEGTAFCTDSRVSSGCWHARFKIHWPRAFLARLIVGIAYNVTRNARPNPSNVSRVRPRNGISYKRTRDTKIARTEPSCEWGSMRSTIQQAVQSE
ncbi:unnamed protein product, partial [Sphacelaria rigidula]